MNTLTKYEAAKQAIIQAESYDEVKDIRDKAVAMQAYAQQAKDTTLERNAARIKLRAERRVGEMLRDMEKAKGGQPYQDNPTGNTVAPVETPTLAEIGITKRQSSDWQRMADIDEAEFEVRLEDTALSTSSMINKVIEKDKKKAAKESYRNTMPRPNLPDENYDVIYADPPWKYNDKQDTPLLGGAEKHYPTMTISELCGLEVPSADNAVLFFWVTSPLLEECFDVINAWGFKYKASFVWDKIKHNMGHYNSVRHEFLLVCTKGSKTPEHIKLFDSVQSIERTGHSEKPEEFRTIIETIYPNGKKLELFARKQVQGWDVWGNESE